MVLPVGRVLLGTLVIGFTLKAENTRRQQSSGEPFQVLIFTKIEHGEYRHSVTPTAVKAIERLGVQEGFHATVTDDSGIFSNESLSRFRAVIFINNTGDILEDVQQEAFQQYLKSGKGVVIIHAGILIGDSWPWFGELVGARFVGHPEVQDADVTLIAPDHRACKGLPSQWRHRDEWYNFEATPRGVTPLVLVDETSYEGGTHSAPHPIVWVREYEGTRVFYSAMGHTEESWTDEIFLRHIANGITYAATPEQR